MFRKNLVKTHENQVGNSELTKANCTTYESETANMIKTFKGFFSRLIYQTKMKVAFMMHLLRVKVNV